MEFILTGSLTFSSLNQLDLTKCSKTDIRKYFLNSYDLNESIFTALKDDDVFYCFPDRLRLPLIFYFGHTAVVYVNKLMLAGLIKERINLNFETLFETGVDEMSWDDTSSYRISGCLEWPVVKDVVDYRRQVKNLILDVIETTALKLPITMDSPWWSLLMGIEHERIHLETSSVLIRQLPIYMVVKPAGWKYAAVKSVPAVTENPFIVVESNKVTLGKPTDFPSYGWDNEYGQTTINVPKFEATKYLITNRQFLEFVLDNGYRRQDLWSAEGWEWKTFRGAEHPTFWVCNQNCKSGCGGKLANISHCQTIEIDANDSTVRGYRYRLMFDVIDLPLDWPVEVNYHEAKAFCCWTGPDFRLTTEAEIMLLRGNKMSPSEGVKYDMIHHEEQKVNLNLKFGSPTPVNYFEPSSRGFYDTQGNVWQWLEDNFNGLDGFRTHWLYDDYSTPCFHGKHNIMVGGSWISTGNVASSFSRFGFRRHFFQHAGFRLARSLEPSTRIPSITVGAVIQENGNAQNGGKDIVNSEEKTWTATSSSKQYVFDEKANISGILELEFGIRKPLSAASAQMAMAIFRQGSFHADSALVIGISAGRTAFELSKAFSKVLAVDYSEKMVSVAEQIRCNGHVTQTNADGVKREYALDDKCQPKNVVFKQLTWLPNEIYKQDLIMVMFLERVENPNAWLARVWEIGSSKSLVFIVSKDDAWSYEKLKPILQPRMSHVFDRDCTYQSADGDKIATLSVWSKQSTRI